MKHLDLFSGIGGFAYAAQQVWEVYETVAFIEIDPFCQAVLKKHWPKVPIHGDIKTFTNTKKLGDRRNGGRLAKTKEKKIDDGTKPLSCNQVDLLTGGFPCQPFSQAGKRRGTEDDRYLWPEMLRVIRLTKPTWIIGENVGGLVTWNEGMVLEQVCLDLEAEGYEVQPIVIPACAKNAPHRRDRVWIVGNSKSGPVKQIKEIRKRDSSNSTGGISDATNTQSAGSKRGGRVRSKRLRDKEERYEARCKSEGCDWNQDWLEVATRLCRVDDGVPQRVDRLKSLGNAIVPQVAMEIMQGIKMIDPITGGR